MWHSEAVSLGARDDTLAPLGRESDGELPSLIAQSQPRRKHETHINHQLGNNLLHWPDVHVVLSQLPDQPMQGLAHVSG